MPTGSIAGSSSFGASLGSIGDADGDGVIDVVVGANNDDTSGTDSGAVYILYMAQHNATDPVLAFTKLTSSVAGLSGLVQTGSQMRCGSAHADIDGDGRVDLLLGMPFDDTGGESRGAIAVALMGGAIASASPIPGGKLAPSSTPSVSPIVSLISTQVSPRMLSGRSVSYKAELLLNMIPIA